MMQRSRRRHILALSIARACACLVLLPLLLEGCTLFAPKPPELLREASAEQLMELLENRAAAIQTVKGLFRVQVRGPGIPFAQRVQAALYFQRPGALRLKGFTPFGGDLFEFVLGDGGYRLRLASDGKSFAGPVTELDSTHGMARPFRLSALVMSGVVGIAPVPRGAAVQLDEDGGRYRLEVYPPGVTVSTPGAKPVRRIWFERQSLQVVKEERLTAEGDIDATLLCEDFRSIAGQGQEGDGPAGPPRLEDVFVRPFKLSAEDGKGEGALVMTFIELTPNVPLSSKDLGQDQGAG